MLMTMIKWKCDGCLNTFVMIDTERNDEDQLHELGWTTSPAAPGCSPCDCYCPACQEDLERCVRHNKKIE